MVRFRSIIVFLDNQSWYATEDSMKSDIDVNDLGEIREAVEHITAHLGIHLLRKMFVSLQFKMSWKKLLGMPGNTSALSKKVIRKFGTSCMFHLIQPNGLIFLKFASFCFLFLSLMHMLSESSPH